MTKKNSNQIVNVNRQKGDNSHRLLLTREKGKIYIYGVIDKTSDIREVAMKKNIHICQK